MNLHPQLKNYKFYVILFGDIVIFILAHIFAYLGRFEFSLTPEIIGQIKTVLIWLVPLKLMVFLIFGLYRGMWRYTGIRDLWLLLQATIVSSLLIIAIIFYTNKFVGYSRTVFVADGILTFLLVGGKRVLVRSLFAAFGNGRDFA